MDNDPSDRSLYILQTVKDYLLMIESDRSTDAEGRSLDRRGVVAAVLSNFGTQVNARNDRGETLLAVALRNNTSPRVVRELLLAGASVTARDRSGHTPLHLVFFNLEPYIENVILLLLHKADVNAKNNHLNTPLHYCLKWRYCQPEMAELLLERGADVNARNSKMKTPLHILMSSRDPQIGTVKVLLDHKADVNAKNLVSMTPLHSCLDNRHSKDEVVELLLKYGADVTAKDTLGFTPLHYPMFNVFNRRPRLETASLLIQYKANVNAVSRELKTPLHLYIQHWDCRPPIVELLLKHGADLRAEDIHNSTPLDVALRTDKITIAKTIINYVLINEYDFDLMKIIKNYKGRYDELAVHIEFGAREINVMKRHRVNDKFSLYSWYRFVNRRVIPKPLYTTKMISKDGLSKRYHSFGSTLWGVIGPCLDRADLFCQLEELKSTEVWSKLGFDCLRQIAEYLRNTDLSNLISAFKLPVPSNFQFRPVLSFIH